MSFTQCFLSSLKPHTSSNLADNHLVLHKMFSLLFCDKKFEEIGRIEKFVKQYWIKAGHLTGCGGADPHNSLTSAS